MQEVQFAITTLLCVFLKKYFLDQMNSFYKKRSFPEIYVIAYSIQKISNFLGMVLSCAYEGKFCKYAL